MIRAHVHHDWDADHQLKSKSVSQFDEAKPRMMDSYAALKAKSLMSQGMKSRHFDKDGYKSRYLLLE